MGIDIACPSMKTSLKGGLSMSTNGNSGLFTLGTVEMLQLTKLIDWTKADSCRLWLPPIQRSIVWSNEQVINYWDSLLRGYPAGTMMVHRVNGLSKGRDSEDGKTYEINSGDFQLFDGQQRMAAILLGLNRGQMRHDRKLWVDFGTTPNKSSGLLFQLRVTSAGQPFGYRPDAPNQKIELGKRQIKWRDWREKQGRDAAPQEAFAAARGSDIIDAKCACSFEEVCACLCRSSIEDVVSAFSRLNGAVEQTVRKFVSALRNALESEVIVQKVDSKIVNEPDEYIRFFGRLGQGGTRLSDDELTYSIIKYWYPEINDRMKEIMQDGGRLAGEVDLVLAALRVAKTMRPWDNAKEWEVIGRPSPIFVAQLSEKKEVESEFKAMIGLDGRPSKLANALKGVRDTLVFNKETHPQGLPNMLLARLPSELIDVLILFDVKRPSGNRLQNNGYHVLRAFVLHWLLFVGDGAKAAWHAFQHALEKNNPLTEKDLILDYEKEGISRFLPRSTMLSNLRKEVEDGNHLLRQWTERFTKVDLEDERKPGEALRVLSTNIELIKRALIWLQRDYIVDEFPAYNPLSDRDEDLPFDLDHIVPSDIFGFDWRNRDSRLKQDVICDNFRWQRGLVGNSLGNFRWLSASDNRGRHEGACTPVNSKNGDRVNNHVDWNKIIPQDKNRQLWSKEDIASFQRLIDFRTLDLYEELLVDGGIESILPPTKT